jgi:zinc transporter ZupT
VRVKVTVPVAAMGRLPAESVTVLPYVLLVGFAEAVMVVVAFVIVKVVVPVAPL